MNDYLALILGVVCAGIGGELFVRGAVGLASWARISPGIVGATVVAFATSSPELSVSINAALAGKPQIGLGNALGSNVVNVALILGLALLISGIQSPRDSIKRDFPVALLIPIITGVLFLDARNEQGKSENQGNIHHVTAQGVAEADLGFSSQRGIDRD